MKTRDTSKPFCLMVHHKAPHTPHQYPKKYEKLYADAPLPKPENFYGDYETRGAALTESRGRWSKLDYVTPAHFNKDVPEGLKEGTQAYKDWGYQCFFKGYLRLVAALDDNMGRLLAYLDASGLADNTIVVYTSDNGFFLGDFGLFNKMWMYEESLRLPLLVRYPPEIKPGTVNDDIVSILDFGPTFLDYAQREASAELQGESIRPVLAGKTPADWREAHYYHFYDQVDVPAHYGIRTAEHKLIHYYELPGETGWELYDLKEDPQENRNLYGQPEQAEVVQRMKLRLKELRSLYEDAGR
jgi:arylsulfatase A-like enzyme